MDKEPAAWLGKVFEELAVRYRSAENTTALTFQEKLADICVMQGEIAQATDLYDALLAALKMHYGYQKSWISRINHKLKKMYK